MKRARVSIRAFESGTAGLQGMHASILDGNILASIEEEIDALTQESSGGNGSAAQEEGNPAPKDGDNATSGTAANDVEADANGSSEQAGGDRAENGTAENPYEVDNDDDVPEANGGEDNEDEAMKDDDSSSEEEEEESTKWRDAYKEYKSYDRKLKIYDSIGLILFNAERRSMLKALSRAEARGEVCYIEACQASDQEECDDKIDSLEHDLKAIREAVRFEKIRLRGERKQYGMGKISRGSYTTLWGLIDAQEESIEYDDGKRYDFPCPDDDGDSEMVG